MFHTPPNPQKGNYNTPPAGPLGHLMKFYEMGIITKEQLQRKVLA